MQIQFVIVGKGYLADYIQNKVLDIGKSLNFPIGSVVNWDSSFNNEQYENILIHAGSGRQLPDVFEYCQQNKTPLIQASTGIDYSEYQPKPLGFILIEAPNLSIPIIKLLYVLKKNGSLFKQYGITINESHQKRKTSLPATAKVMAEAFEKPMEIIKSIRDPVIQKNEYQIPDEYIDQHAVHVIGIQEGSCKITIKSEAYGYDSYLYGIISIAKAITKLNNGKYFITDLVQKGIL